MNMETKKQLIRKAEDETLNTLKMIHPGIFMLDCRFDYALDKLLETGVTDVLGMARFIQKQARTLRPVLNTKPDGFACSAFNAEDPSGHVLMGRNFDYKESPCVVLWTHPENGYRSINTLTVNFMAYGIKHQRIDRIRRPSRLIGSPYVCMDGMNEKGLAIAILEIKAEPTKQRTGRTPVIPPVIVRAVLDRCASVGEAVAEFEKYDMNDLIGVNYHYMLADATGAGAIVEYVDDRMHVIYPDNGGGLVLTNYFLTEGGNNERGRGFDRRDDIISGLGSCGGVLGDMRAMELLSSATLFYKHPKYPHMVTTCWSSVFDMTGGTQLTCCSMDYSKAYRFSVFSPCEYEKLATGINFVKTERH